MRHLAQAVQGGGDGTFPCRMQPLNWDCGGTRSAETQAPGSKSQEGSLGATELRFLPPGTLGHSSGS